MAVAVALACALPSLAVAQVQVVNTTADHPPNGCAPGPVQDCTLREAIGESAAPEVEVPAVGDYELTEGELLVNRSVIIRGTGGPLATIRRADLGFGRVLRIVNSSAVRLQNVRVANGRMLNNAGGGILIEAASNLELFASEVVDNTALNGGGIWAQGALQVERSLVARNVAVAGDGPGLGGGIGLGAGSATANLLNTTISDNEAINFGGGIYTRRSMTLLNVSIVDNTAPPRDPLLHGGGLYQEFSGEPGPPLTTARNVLLARNSGGGCGGTADPFAIDSNNGLIDELQPTCNTDPVDNFAVADARVGPLQNNGGPTLTHGLLDGSPATDSGAGCLGDDQRGSTRPVGFACDIGAVEMGVAGVNRLTDDSDGGGCTGVHCTLREAVQAAVDGTVINLDPGTFVLDDNEPLRLDEDVEIVGAGARLTTIDANRTSRIGFVTDADVEISGVTVTGGDADAGDNGAQGFGGAFYVSNSGELTLRQTALVDNIARVVGGAVANEGTLAFDSSLAVGNVVRGNNPALGGAIWSSGETTLFNSTISGNTADPDGGNATRGGGVYLIGTSFIGQSTITGNTAAEGAGLHDVSGNSTIVGSIIAGNDGPECGDDQSMAEAEEHHNIASDTSCQFDA